MVCFICLNIVCHVPFDKCEVLNILFARHIAPMTISIVVPSTTQQKTFVWARERGEAGGWAVDFINF